jgi:DNA-directed RNA polymerase specialized sigma24 family protein
VERRVEPVEDVDVLRPAVTADGPERVVLDREDGAVLWGAVARLSDRHRALLSSIAFPDYASYATISARMGMPIGSIGPTRRRTLDKVRRMLAAEAA